MSRPKLALSRTWLAASALTVALAFLAAPVAEAAQAKKQRSQVSKPRVSPPGQTLYRGTNLFMAGPMYNGLEYLGDDPDPFIRFQLLRDLPARYGGGND
jgi:hypothetical protein